MTNGNVPMLSRDVDPQVLGALATPSSGEPVP
jgi:hypothetical protein